MEIKIEYLFGERETYKAYIADEAAENVSACLLDDDSVKVIHSTDDNAEG